MSSNQNSYVGFIGLGVMGREMSRNLIQAGYNVAVYDVRADAADELVSMGARRADSIADAVRDADIAITMLPDTPQVEEVVLGEHGLRANPPKGRLFVDMSTISPQATKRMHAILGQQGIGMLDAPVSGGPQGAIKCLPVHHGWW